MSKTKFDTFYYEREERIMDFSEIRNLPDDVYFKKYHNEIFCPSCKTARLGRVCSNGNVFLRTYPESRHGENGDFCMYMCDEASPKVVEKRVEQLRDQGKLKSMLEASLRKLLFAKTKKSETSSNSFVEEPLVIAKINSDRTESRVIIPHKSLLSWGKDIPEGKVMIFYGKVHIENKECKDGKTFLHFRRINDNSFITSTSRAREYNIKDGNYAVAILGKAVRNDTYLNLEVIIPESSCIVISQVP